MFENHISWELLESVARGEVPGEILVTRMARHLMAVCPECRLACQKFVDGHPSNGTEEFLIQPLLDVLGVWQETLATLHDAAEKELAELLELVPEERIGRIQRAVKRFRNPVLVELLLEQAKNRVTGDPQEARALAEAALEVALRLNAGKYGLALPHELALRAQAYRANALRVAGELTAAEQGMAAPLRKIAEIPDPLTQAEILSLGASLRRDQRRFQEALEQLDRAASIYREIDHSGYTARTLLQAAQVLREMGEFEEAILAAQAASAGVNAEVDAHLYLCAQHELSCVLADAGRYLEARQVMDANQALYESFPDRWTQLRRQWLQGRIAHGLSELERAEVAYQRVREGYLAQELPYDAAVASLDLALLYTEQHRFEEVRQLAEEMVLVFRAQKVHREAFAALVLFRDATKTEAITVERVQQLAAYLARARQNPSLARPDRF